MRRISFFLVALFTFHLSLISSPVFAQGEFATVATAEYSVSETGRTRVTHGVTLTNNFSEIHAVSYTFSIYGVRPLEITAHEGEIQLPTTIEEKEKETKILITFPKAVVGKGESRTFTINYYDDKTAIKNGQVWEITIPKIEDLANYTSYNTTLFVPKNFGNPAYLSPRPTSRVETETSNSYFYEGSQIAQSGVVAAFGNFQIFNFTLAYHLQNPYNKEGITEIALPPDTAFQRVYYEKIEPEPAIIRVDADGNWIASYPLKAGQQIDVNVGGSAQLFAEPQEFYDQQEVNRKDNLKPSEFWQTEDPELKAVARSLKTTREIYEYVVSTLNYDYKRVRPGINRLGAKVAYESPESAICMEFTDLFVTLARAAGIPAREVNGFAYTENPELQPLSLVSDVLHSWPEYFDEVKNIWIPVDPTWGKTTGGVDYFSKFDLSHITFAIHGQDSSSPLPAGSYKLADNPQKDVVVYFGNLPETRDSRALLSINIDPKLVPFVPYKGKLTVRNDGPVAIYNLPIKVGKASGKVELVQNHIASLPPFSSYEIPFTWTTDLLDGAPTVAIFAQNWQVSYTVPHEFIFWQFLGLFAIPVVLGVILLSPIVLRKKLFARIEGHKNAGKTNTQKPTKFPWRLPF